MTEIDIAALRALAEEADAKGYHWQASVALRQALTPAAILSLVDRISADAAEIGRLEKRLTNADAIRKIDWEDISRWHERFKEEKARAEAAEARTTELAGALDRALKRLAEHEPGDSRAVSDDFVTMAAALAGIKARAAAGNRTFDELSRDLYWCHCEANAALHAAGEARREPDGREPDVPAAIVCPECKGNGETKWRHRFGSGWKFKRCANCLGDGWVEPEETP